jgi:hypothetical protein
MDNYAKANTNNILFNILNNDEPHTIFIYGIMLTFFLFIFSNINFNTNILIGLLFFSILIYYIYTYRLINTINSNKKENIKFNTVCTPNTRLEKYPEIIDVLYYMDDYKAYNISLFDELIILFNSFIELYEDCLKDITLINSVFINLRGIEINIYDTINSFIFSVSNNNYCNKLLEIKKETNIILNKLLNNLITIHKKLIYYNGYNINTQSINDLYSNVLPSNMYDNVLMV